MKHIYDVILLVDLSKQGENVGKIMAKINKTFQEMSGLKDKVTTAMPITLKMTTSKKLEFDELEKIRKAFKSNIEDTEFKLDNIKYIGVTN